MAASKYVALTFFWPELQRQVRYEGYAEKVSAAESDEYFASRPRESQLGAWASAQSTVIKNREVIEKKLAELTTKYEGKSVPVRRTGEVIELFPTP